MQLSKSKLLTESNNNQKLSSKQREEGRKLSLTLMKRTESQTKLNNNNSCKTKISTDKNSNINTNNQQATKMFSMNILMTNRTMVNNHHLNKDTAMHLRNKTVEIKMDTMDNKLN